MNQGNVHKAIQDLLAEIEPTQGTVAARDGLEETPHRVTKAFKHWFSGYGQDPAKVLKAFDCHEIDGGDRGEMVLIRNIPVYSKCEHHLADIFGHATVAYVPKNKVVGLSKFSRLVDIYARRLQVQERLTHQIVDAIMEHVDCDGAACRIVARHMCMESRGICQQGQETVTTALRGNIRRSEFLHEARS